MTLDPVHFVGMQHVYTKGAKRLAATVPFCSSWVRTEKMSVWEVVFLCGPIAAPPCTLPKEHSKTRTQDSLWRGAMLAFLLLTCCSTSMYSAKQEHPKTRTHYSLRGGMLVIFVWTISAANRDRTMRSARPPLFVTLLDTLLDRF